MLFSFNSNKHFNVKIYNFIEKKKSNNFLAKPRQNDDEFLHKIKIRHFATRLLYLIGSLGARLPNRIGSPLSRLAIPRG